jgi:lysozyme
MKAAHKVAGAIAICMTVTAAYEGLDLVAKRDRIGTGHPITYCHGLTSTDGAVAIGQRFTPEQCKELLAGALPKYLVPIEACIHISLPDKVKASLLDAAYNAGPAAVCKSSMLVRMNAGDLAGGCNAFKGWYIRASGKVVKGLINRRNGERQLCLQGLSEKPIPHVMTWREFFNQWRSK